MAYPFARWLVIPLLRRRIARVTGAEFLPRSLPFIAVANHSSWLDSAYLIAALATSVEKQVYVIASTAKYRRFGGLPIDPRQPDRVLDQCAEKLAQGHAVLVFPEGNSNPEPMLRHGKTGAARLAIRTRATILPIGIRGTHQSNFLTSLFYFFCWWRPVTVHIGRQLAIPPATSIESLTRDIMLSISHLSGKALPYA